MSKRKKKHNLQTEKPEKKEAYGVSSRISIDTLIEEYNSDFDALSTVHSEFSDKEKMLLGVNIDAISGNTTKSQIVDPTLQTAILKQNNETMAQMPSGKVDTYLADKGKGLLMNLLLEHHIIPNANTQFDMYTKLWLMSLYRKVYGSFGVLVDYVDTERYRGADFSLIPARSLIPQKGKYTVDDCGRLCVRSKVSKDWLLQRDPTYWKDIDKLLESANEVREDSDYDSYVETKYGNTATTNTGKKEEYELITRYEGDRWITFSKDGKCILRDIENPQKNGEIPVVVTHAYPLIDRFFGLGDFERGKTLHRAASSLINLYMDGVKMSIFPPLKAYAKDLVMSSIKRDPAAIWYVKNSNMNAIDQMQLSPLGLNTFQSTYGFLKGAILSMTNTTDTSVSQTVDPGMGKTPQALKMQQLTQGMRASFDRKMMDIGIEKIYNKLIDVTVARQEKPIKLKFMSNEIDQIVSRFPDVQEMIGFERGELVIAPEDIQDTKYKFNIDAGSTLKKDEAAENETLTSFIELLFKIPNATQQISQTGFVQIGEMRINFAEIIKRWIISSGTSDWDKLIEQGAALGVPQEVLQQTAQGFPVQQQPSQGMQPTGDPEIDQIMQEIINGNRSA